MLMYDYVNQKETEFQLFNNYHDGKRQDRYLSYAALVALGLPSTR